MGDFYSTKLRNDVTKCLNENIEFIYEHNMSLYHNLIEELIYSKELNIALKNYLSNSSDKHILDLYLNTTPNPAQFIGSKLLLVHVETFKNINFDEPIEAKKAYRLILDVIHKIFYRLYIKGGSAIKSIIEYIFIKKEADVNIVIPNGIINPTDIDSACVLNPALMEEGALKIEEVLLRTLEICIERVMLKERVKYTLAQLMLIQLLNMNKTLVNEMNRNYSIDGRQLLFGITSNKMGYLKPEGRANYTKKLDKNALKLFSQLFTGMRLFRILIDVGIYTEDEKKIDKSTDGEIIDVIYYNWFSIEIEKKKAWDYGCRAIKLENNFILFMSFEDLISDLNYLLSLYNEASILKKSKREARHNFLIYCYCVYKMFRDHFETNQHIEYKHIEKYCYGLVENRLEGLDLPLERRNELVPILISNTDKTIKELIYIAVDNIIYRMDYKSVKYNIETEIFHLRNNISEKQYDRLKEQLRRITAQMPEQMQLIFLSNLVGLYNKSLQFGEFSYLIFTSLMEEPIGNISSYGVRLLDRFNHTKNILMKQQVEVLNRIFSFANIEAMSMATKFKDTPIDIFLNVKQIPNILTICQKDRNIYEILDELPVSIETLLEKTVITEFADNSLNVLLPITIKKTINLYTYEGTIYPSILVIKFVSQFNITGYRPVRGIQNVTLYIEK